VSTCVRECVAVCCSVVAVLLQCVAWLFITQCYRENVCARVCMQESVSERVCVCERKCV